MTSYKPRDIETQDDFEVICVCGGFGYPFGNASASRITMMGLALQAAGIQLRLLHCGPSSSSANTRRSGVHRGIPFTYTTGVQRPAGRLARLLAYTWAVIVLTFRLIQEWPRRRSRVVYLYVMESPLALYVGLLCRVLGLPIVQELCEWFPGDAECPRFVRWFHKGPMFRLASGVLTISRFTEERAKAAKLNQNPSLVIHRVPSITDAESFQPAHKDRSEAAIPEFVYCGTWLTDVDFLIDAFAALRATGQRCRLKMVGEVLESFAPAILKRAAASGIPPADIAFTGLLEEAALKRCFSTAAALLLPLWNDERSLARMPNKLPEYLASGAPVIASNVGEIRDLLVDGETAYLAAPGDHLEFANKMGAVLENPLQAANIGAAGREAAFERLDFRVHATKLGTFFRACGDAPDTARVRGIAAIARFVRNTVCGTAALVLIGSGFVSRARRAAFRRDRLTAVYFHKPNPKLFVQVVQWLTRNRYVFVSVDDVFRFVREGSPLPEGAVWLSFDDGCRELLTGVLPHARERRIPVTLFIPSGIVNGDGLFAWVPADQRRGRDAMTLAELKEVARFPEVTIASHTVNHRITAGLSGQSARTELHESRQDLESWTGMPVRYFAYPAGRFDGREAAILAECGYELAFTTENALIAPACDRFRVPRFAVADDIWLPEAICNLVGAWRPLADPLHRFVARLRRLPGLSRRPACGFPNRSAGTDYLT